MTLDRLQLAHQARRARWWDDRLSELRHAVIVDPGEDPS